MLPSAEQRLLLVATAPDHHQPHPTAMDSSARMLSETLWPPSVECKNNPLAFKSLRVEVRRAYVL